MGEVVAIKAACPPTATAGGEDRLEDVACRYRPALLRYFRRHLEQADEAEDFAQETLARFGQSVPTGQVDNVEAYLLRIAGNLLRDHARRDRARSGDRHVPLESIEDAWPGEQPSCERIYASQARLRTFLAALDELPPRCQQVFLLQRYEGMTYSAIANRLGISVSAVEKHMMRGLQHFAARMGTT